MLLDWRKWLKVAFCGASIGFSLGKAALFDLVAIPDAIKSIKDLYEAVNVNYLFI